MAERLEILKTIDSHLVYHLLAPGEADLARRASNGAPGEADGVQHDMPGEPGDTQGELGGSQGHAPKEQQNTSASSLQSFQPENLVDDLIDEVGDMLDEASEAYAEATGWEKPLVLGFVDGVIAVSNDTWSTLEDSYFEDMGNPDFAGIDAAIDQLAQSFEGERPWDETAKGHVRTEVAHSDIDPAELDTAFWAVYAHGFMYGADAAYDLEWKLVVTPAGNLLLTDEESLSEASIARMQAETGSGSLIDRVFDMIGVDPAELAAVLGEDDEDENGDDGYGREESGEGNSSPNEDGAGGRA